MGTLFRDEVVRARRSESLGAINLAVPLTFVWWALLAVSLAAAIVLFLVFGHYTRRADVAGQLEPAARLLTTTATMLHRA